MGGVPRKARLQCSMCTPHKDSGSSRRSLLSVHLSYSDGAPPQHPKWQLIHQADITQQRGPTGALGGGGGACLSFGLSHPNAAVLTSRYQV